MIVAFAAGLLWFMLPASLTNPDWLITIHPDDVPPIVSLAGVPTGKFVLVHTDDDALVALYGIAPGYECFVRWVPLNHRFESPCYGSKFELNGQYIEGPSPRSLDRYALTIIFTDGSRVRTNELGDPIPLNGREIASITVDIHRRIERAGRV
jgi:cytochrome b6-f complex iron-sulfur subunit